MLHINPKWKTINKLNGPARQILITSPDNIINTIICHDYDPLNTKRMKTFRIYKPTHFCEIPTLYIYPIDTEFNCCQKCSEREQKLQDENQALRNQVALLEKTLEMKTTTY